MPLIERAWQQYPVAVEKDVEMRARDGVVLRADVYHPDAPGRFPVLVSRGPYGKEGRGDPNGVTHYFARYGYVCVVQDCRGRFASEGEYDPIFQEVADGYDCVEWAARLPWSNGRVGTTGQSYLGLTQYALACHDPLPPSLQAMAPVSASSDYHASWDFHTGGVSLWGWLIPYAILKGRNTVERAGRAGLLAELDAYLDPAVNFGRPLTDAWYRHLPLSDWVEKLAVVAPYLADRFAQADDSPYWQRVNVACHAERIDVPMLHISSWYDIFAEGAPAAFQAIRTRGRSARARAAQRLIMGPWAHLFPYDLPSSAGTGEADFGPAARIDLRRTLLRWFDHWLKDIDTGLLDGPPVSVFTMGENRWQELADWTPPAMNPTRFYLHGGGGANTLHGDGVLSTTPPDAEPADRYTYDPADPVPTRGGANLMIPFGVMDQRPVEERPDVLVYTSAPLDRPLEITGPVTVELWAATTAPDTDFTAKLVDVQPDGYARNLLDGVIRARYRAGGDRPAPIVPGEVARYTIDLWATSHVFLPGHRIRVEVSSSNFPRFDRNLNTGAPFGQGTEMRTADQTVFHDRDRPSCIVLPLIPR
jgi:uncharacterized protein